MACWNHICLALFPSSYERKASWMVSWTSTIAHHHCHSHLYLMICQQPFTLLKFGNIYSEGSCSVQGFIDSLPRNYSGGASKETFNSALISTGMTILDKWPKLRQSVKPLYTHSTSDSRFCHLSNFVEHLGQRLISFYVLPQEPKCCGCLIWEYTRQIVRSTTGWWHTLPRETWLRYPVHGVLGSFSDSFCGSSRLSLFSCFWQKGQFVRALEGDRFCVRHLQLTFFLSHHFCIICRWHLRRHCTHILAALLPMKTDRSGMSFSFFFTLSLRFWNADAKDNMVHGLKASGLVWVIACWLGIHALYYLCCTN